MLWGIDRHVDHEQAVNGLLYEARKLLGDNSEEPLYIETVPRSGYRFVAPVSIGEHPLVSREDPLLPARRWSRPAVALSFLVLILLGSGTCYWAADPRGETLPRITVGVGESLPEAGTSYRLAFDLAEKLTQSLVTEHGRAIAIVSGYDGAPAPEIDYSAEVAARELPDVVRVQLRFVDPRTGQVRWVKGYSIESGDRVDWCERASAELALAVLVEWNESVRRKRG